jgi:hypothetical protein
MQRVAKCCSILASAIAMLLVPLAPPASAATDTVVPPSQTFAGKTYGEWSVAWWQWAAGITTSESTLNDPKGANCAVHQQGPVWFLTGTTGGTKLTRRKCTVPAGQGILFPIINGECSSVEGQGTTEPQLRRCAKDQMDQVTSATARVDGVPVELGRLDHTPYRVQSSGLFNITFVDNNQFGISPGSGNSFADGFYVLVNPPTKGRHTFAFRGEAPAFNFTVNVQYDLTIS